MAALHSLLHYGGFAFIIDNSYLKPGVILKVFVTLNYKFGFVA